MNDDLNFYQKRYFGRLNPSSEDIIAHKIASYRNSYEHPILPSFLDNSPVIRRKLGWVFIFGFMALYLIGLAALMIVLIVVFADAISNINMTGQEHILVIVTLSVFVIILIVYCITWGIDFIANKVKL